MPRSESRFHGIYPMAYAFFDSQGRLDREAMRLQVEACIAAGANGMAALGLATEVDKLSLEERHQVLEWVAADVAGRVPLAITVFGNTAAEQVNFVQAAAAAGADWVILQPPRTSGLSEQDCAAFFGAVMEASPLPVAIQNAPEFLGFGLSADSIETLRRAHDSFVVLKGEGPVVQIKEVIDRTGGRLAVFNGRNGLELPDDLRAGCAGIIPTPESCQAQARIYELMQSGSAEDEVAAERLYQEILPALVFVMQSLESLHCYGKRIHAWSLGLEAVHDRSPCLQPTDFGLACARRHAAKLGLSRTQ